MDPALIAALKASEETAKREQEERDAELAAKLAAEDDAAGSADGAAGGAAARVGEEDTPHIYDKITGLTVSDSEQIFTDLNEHLQSVNVLGDGKCFFYAVFVSLYFNYPNVIVGDKKISEYKLDSFKNPAGKTILYSDEFKDFLCLQATNDPITLKINLSTGNTLRKDICSFEFAEESMILWLINLLQINIHIYTNENNNPTMYYRNYEGSDTTIYLFKSTGHYYSFINNEINTSEYDTKSLLELILENVFDTKFASKSTSPECIACPACTFENELKESKCIMCSTELSGSKSSESKEEETVETAIERQRRLISDEINNLEGTVKLLLKLSSTDNWIEKLKISSLENKDLVLKRYNELTEELNKLIGEKKYYKKYMKYKNKYLLLKQKL